MKTKLTVIITILSCLTLVIMFATENNEVYKGPPDGTFYSYQKPHHPPYPYNPFPDTEVVEIEDNIFIFDDSSIEYTLLRK